MESVLKGMFEARCKIYDYHPSFKKSILYHNGLEKLIAFISIEKFIHFTQINKNILIFVFRAVDLKEKIANCIKF